MSGRRTLAEHLETALPGWQIVSDAHVIDTVRKPGAAVVWTSRRRRWEKLGFDWLDDEITVWVLTAAEKAADIEDDLDDLLIRFLAALEDQPAYSWTEAERGVLAEKFQGWRVPVTCLYQLET